MQQVAALLLCTTLLSTPAFAAGGQTSHDGLELVKKDRSTALYVRPGASLAQYDRVAILDCPVAFRKNWERDQNRERNFEERISKQDMERIKKALSEEFLKIFKRELQDEGLVGTILLSDGVQVDEQLVGTETDQLERPVYTVEIPVASPVGHPQSKLLSISANRQ